MDNKIIENRIKRSNKKKARLLSEENGVYTIIFIDLPKAKVKLATVYDGMYTRYGIKTHVSFGVGVLSAFWQDGNGYATEENIKAMELVLYEMSDLPVFDFATIKDLQD